MHNFHRFQLEGLSEDELEGIQGLDSHILICYDLDLGGPYYIEHGHSVGSAVIRGKLNSDEVGVRLAASGGLEKTVSIRARDPKNQRIIFSGLDDCVRAFLDGKDFPDVFYQKIHDITDEERYDLFKNFEHPWQMGYKSADSKSSLTLSSICFATKMMKRRFGLKDLEIDINISAPLGLVLEFPFPFHKQKKRYYVDWAICIRHPITESAIDAMKTYLNLDDSYSPNLVSNGSYAALYYVARKADHTHVVFPNPMFFDNGEGTHCQCDYSLNCQFAKHAPERIDVIASDCYPRDLYVERAKVLFGSYQMNNFILLSHRKYEKLRNYQGLQLYPYAIDVGDYARLFIARGNRK